VRREFGTRDGRLESSVARLALTRAISELPAGYRTIFLLHQVEGYEHHEIAEFSRMLGGQHEIATSQSETEDPRIPEVGATVRSGKGSAGGHDSSGVKG
jgi:hypothetical protein